MDVNSIKDVLRIDEKREECARKRQKMRGYGQYEGGDVVASSNVICLLFTWTTASVWGCEEISDSSFGVP